jgi:hypothetical protein
MKALVESSVIERWHRIVKAKDTAGLITRFKVMARTLQAAG